MRNLEHDEQGAVSIAATGEVLLMSTLDELEMVVADPEYGKTDSNHIFINAVPVLEVRAAPPLISSDSQIDSLIRYTHTHTADDYKYA